MQSKISLKIKTIMVDDQKQTTEMFHMHEGMLYRKENDIFIRYQEHQEQNLGNTTTIIKWPVEEIPNEVVILRQGDTRMKQLFREGYKDGSHYHSPYGLMELITETEQVKIEVEENKGIIQLKYTLWMNEQILGLYQLLIDFKEEHFKS